MKKFTGVAVLFGVILSNGCKFNFPPLTLHSLVCCRFCTTDLVPISHLFHVADAQAYMKVAKPRVLSHAQVERCRFGAVTAPIM